MAADPAIVRVGALSGRRLLDETGTVRGHVVDVRLVQDGPLEPGGDARLRVDGLVIGRGQFSERLGLFRKTVHGPWLLEVVAAWLGPVRNYLPWSQVVDPQSLSDGRGGALPRAARRPPRGRPGPDALSSATSCRVWPGYLASTAEAVRR